MMNIFAKSQRIAVILTVLMVVMGAFGSFATVHAATNETWVYDYNETSKSNTDGNGNTTTVTTATWRESDGTRHEAVVTIVTDRYGNIVSESDNSRSWVDSGSSSSSSASSSSSSANSSRTRAADYKRSMKEKKNRDGTKTETITETWTDVNGYHELVTVIDYDSTGTWTKKDETEKVTQTSKTSSTSNSGSSWSSGSNSSSSSSSWSSGNSSSWWSGTNSSNSSSSSSWWSNTGSSSSSSQQYQSNWGITYYGDVPGNSWYYTHAGHVGTKGLMSGFPDGTFRPSEDLTRAQVAAVVYRMMGGVSTSRYSIHQYQDVQGSDWYYNAVRAVAGAFGEDGCDIFSSTLTGQELYTLYYPNNPATRVHLIRLLGNLIDAAGLQYVGPAISGEAPYFYDIGGLDAGTQSVIRSFAQIGLLSGMGDGSFQPNATLTRAQMAKIIDLFTDYYA